MNFYNITPENQLTDQLFVQTILNDLKSTESHKLALLCEQYKQAMDAIYMPFNITDKQLNNQPIANLINNNISLNKYLEIFSQTLKKTINMFKN